MIEYIIVDQADDMIFKKQCQALEKHIPNLKKIRFSHDVDDSKLQFYNLEGKNISVLKDVTVGVVKVKSEIDLLPYFN